VSRRAKAATAAGRAGPRRWNPAADLLEIKAAYDASGVVGKPLPCRSRRGVYAVGGGRTGFDLFAPGLRTSARDWAFAAMASSGTVSFLVPTRHEGAASEYLAAVERDAAIAAARYGRSLRAMFERNKRTFREGYSLPEPPTPELRWLYDAAAAFEAELFPPRPRRLGAADRPRPGARGGARPVRGPEAARARVLGRGVPLAALAAGERRGLRRGAGVVRGDAGPSRAVARASDQDQRIPVIVTSTETEVLR
jgi:hypothetical protein